MPASSLVPAASLLTHAHLVLKGLAEVRVDERHADAEVGLVEVVRDVPPELSVLASLLRDRVEEPEDVNERPEGLVRALRQGLLADLAVALAHVELQAEIGRAHV
jgi:hypothetical protein